MDFPTATIVRPASIRSTRIACGWSLCDLIDESGMAGDRSYLSKIERGKIVPGIEVLEKITTALKRGCLLAEATRERR